MYSHELLKYIKERNSILGGDEIFKIVNVKENPQISHIKYNDGTKQYTIDTNDGYTLEFNVMSYEEAKSRKLIKPRD